MNDIKNEKLPLKSKSFILRFLFDLKDMSLWYFLICVILLLYGKYDMTNYFFVFIVCSIFLIVPIILSYRGNVKHVSKIKFTSDFIYIEILNYDEFRKIEIPIYPLELELFVQIKSYPDPTFLKFSSNKKEIFRFYQSYGWTYEDLIEIKNIVKNIQSGT